MDRKVLVDAVKALLLRVKSATPERATDVLKSLPGRNGYVPRLKLWLDENQSAFPEPFAVEDLDSLHDPGVDVLMTGARSGARIGFQVKSANDLRQKDFTPHLKSQILDAQGIQVDLFVVVFACPPTPANLTKIKYWQNKYLDRVDILCLSPEKAAGLHEVFDRPIQPIILTERTWPDFFRVTGQSHLASRYLDVWPDLPPDQRFLPPENYSAIRKSVQENRLTFLVGSPAVGKTFVSLRLLWDAFQEGRPVHWITATEDEPTEGPIPRAEAEIGLIERIELKRRVDGLLRTLGSPVDDLDIVSRVLVPNALVYIEDPFGKSEVEYSLSLASYSFFDLQRFVEALERSSARADCRLLITSREALFQHWLADLKAKNRKSPSYSVIRLTHNSYYPRPLFNHAVLLGRARGFDQPEEIADVLATHVESPFELDTLIRALPPDTGVAEAESVVVGWEGELRDKIESRIAPRDERDTLMLILVAASDFQYESLASPLGMYSKLHVGLGFEGEPQLNFGAILKRLSPFLGPNHRGNAGSLPFSPSHTIVREAIHNQLTATGSRQLIRRIARALVDIPPRARRPRSPSGGLRLSDLISPWHDSLLVALYLISVGAALEGAEESLALERLVFDQAGISGSGYRKIMAVWQGLPDQLRKRTLERLRRAPREDADGLSQAAAVLPYTKIDPHDAWCILELLLEDPERGSQKNIYEESPWDYLFQHLDEIPLSLSDKLDDWASNDPAAFVYTMDEELIQNWDRLPILWRSSLFHPDCRNRFKVWDRFVRTIVRHWGKASPSIREWFDLVARNPDSSVRALAGSQALFYAELYPDLERYALEAGRDPDLEVRFETFRWGRGDEAHRRVAEALLEGATPGFAADMMLGLFEGEIRDEIVPWEKDMLLRCERIGGSASQAAITSAIFAGKKHAHYLGYKLTDSPFEEPEIVRAAWLWSHLNSNRLRPQLTDDDLRRLLLGFKEPPIRYWCLAPRLSAGTRFT
jgi:hypothetical protein